MNKKTTSQVDFDAKYKKLLDKYNDYIVDSTAVFEMISLVGQNVFGADFEIKNTTPKNHAQYKDTAYVLKIKKEIVALAEHTYVDARPVLRLSFFVGCLANTVVRVYSEISQNIDIPVLTENVFCLKEEKVAGDFLVLYNEDAVAEHNLVVAQAYLEKKQRQSEAESGLEKIQYLH